MPSNLLGPLAGGGTVTHRGMRKFPTRTPVKLRFVWWSWAASFAIVAADTALKLWIVGQHRTTELVDGTIVLGSLPRHSDPFDISAESNLAGLAIAVVILLVVAVWWRHLLRATHIGVALAVLGAAGTLSDYALFGNDVDLVRFRTAAIPPFDLSDVCVLSGLVIIAVSVLAKSPGRRSPHPG